MSRLARACFLSAALVLLSLWTGNGWKRAGAERAAGSVSPLVYAGGPVMSAPATYTIFWTPPGHDFAVLPGTGVTYQDVIDRYLQLVGGTPYYAILAQYAPPGGPPLLNRSDFGGAALDAQPYPQAGSVSDPLRDTDIQREVRAVVMRQGWPAGTSSQFFVFTAAGIQACQTASENQSCTTQSETGVCGWHSSFQLDGRPVIYAVLPEVSTIANCAPHDPGLQSPNGNLPADEEIGPLSHEQFEMATDPLGDGWKDSQNFEIADKCAGNDGAIGPDGANVSLHGAPYRVQSMWSNAASRCMLSVDPGPAPVRSAATPTPTTSLQVVKQPATPSTPTMTALPTPSPVPTPGKHTPRISRERCPSGYRTVVGVCKKRRPHHVGRQARGNQPHQKLAARIA